MILLDNAVKYTPKSGDINITLTHESSDAVLTVRNTGVGISEDAQKQIFERFYREDKVKSKRKRRLRAWSCNSKKLSQPLAKEVLRFTQKE